MISTEERGQRPPWPTFGNLLNEARQEGSSSGKIRLLNIPILGGVLCNRVNAKDGKLKICKDLD